MSHYGFSNPNHSKPLRMLKGCALPLVFALAGALSACTLFPSKEPMQVYQLPSPTASVSETPSLEYSLRISTPQANKTLGGTRVLVVPEAQQISAYGDARWSDTVPTLLRDYLITTFRQSGSFDAVIDESSRVRADFELVSDLRAFQSEYENGQPEAVIQLEAHLVRSNAQNIVASERFEVRTASSSPNVSDIIRAFGQASEDLSAQLIRWSMETAASAE